MTRPLGTLLLTLGALTLLGCPDSKETDTGEDTGEDTGTDTGDTDTGDTDTGTNPTYTGISGSVVYQTSTGGVADCDVEIAYTGTPYTGDCADCTFAFDVEGEIVRDDSVSDCTLSPTYSLVPNDTYTALGLIFWEVFEGYYGSYYNVFGTQYYYYYPGYGELGPYTAYQYYSPSYYDVGTLTWDGTNIAWEMSGDSTSYLYYSAYGGECATSAGVDESATATGEETGTSDHHCGETYAVDVWSFESTTGVATVTVDTVASETAFDPYIYVADENGCFIDSTGYGATSDDGVECTFAPAAYECPSAEISSGAGTYYVIVGSYGSCNGTAGEYEIRVDGGSGLTQVLDNEEISWTTVSETISYLYRLEGAVTE